jgi:hypothetical protein
MGFRYTEVGALMNEGKLGDAAEKLVAMLVEGEVEAAKAEKRAVEVKTNKAEVSRKLDVDYRTVSRWVSLLRSKGHDVIRQAETKLEAIVKEQRAA